MNERKNKWETLWKEVKQNKQKIRVVRAAHYFIVNFAPFN